MDCNDKCDCNTCPNQRDCACTCKYEFELKKVIIILFLIVKALVILF